MQNYEYLKLKVEHTQTRDLHDVVYEGFRILIFSSIASALLHTILEMWRINPIIKSTIVSTIVVIGLHLIFTYYNLWIVKSEKKIKVI